MIRRRALPLALTAAALVAAGPSAARAPGEIEVGQTLREAELQGLNGKARPLSSYRGAPLIINVWASWCGPCRAEMASLERLSWSGAAGKLNIIGISTDDDARAARAWLRVSNATLSHFIDRQLELENMLGAKQIPLTVLVDARGRVAAKIYGAKAWDAPEQVRLIQTAFKAAAPKPAR